jgi:hypothetical protein
MTRAPIGLDFDNTIIAYDQVFRSAAVARGLIPEGFIGAKQEIRDAIRRRPAGEQAWQSLQGHVYGRGIAEARLFDGVGHFLERCRREGVALCIVSHKTEFGHFDPDRVNLREAALHWMVQQRFFDAEGFAIARENVHFEATRAEKLARIAALRCRLFIDDLEEVLNDPVFPAATERLLFAPRVPPGKLPYQALSSWREIERNVFDDAA